MSDEKKPNPLKIPILEKRSVFRQWRDKLNDHLCSKEISHHIKYNVSLPILLNPIERTDETLNLNLPFELPRQFISVPTRIPESVKQKLLNTESSNIQFWFDETDLIPDELFPLTCDCFCLIRVKAELFIICNNKESWRKLTRKFLKEKKLVSHTIKSTIPSDRQYLFTSKKSNYEGYISLTAHFFKELELEQTSILNKMQRLKFRHMGQYIDMFSALVAEFEDCGGSREDRMVHSLFLGLIPDLLSDEKANYSGTSVDEAISFFRIRHDRKLAYRNTSNPQNSTSHRTKSLSKQQLNIKTSKINHEVIKPTVVTAFPRCNKCGGFGHKFAECPTKHNSCYVCGSQEHMKSECPLRLKNVKHIRLRVLTSDIENSEDSVNDKVKSLKTNIPESPNSSVLGESFLNTAESSDVSQFSSSQSSDIFTKTLKDHVKSAVFAQCWTSFQTKVSFLPWMCSRQASIISVFH